MGRVILILLVFVTWQEIHACFYNQKPQLSYKKVGSNFFAVCKCDLPVPGYKAYWQDRNDKVIDPIRPDTNTKVYTAVEDQGVTLYIRSLTDDLAGKYKCIIKMEEKEETRILQIVVFDNIIIESPEEQFLLLGTDSRIFCRIKDGANKDLDVTWHKEELGTFTQLEENERYQFVSDGLAIKNVTVEDGGTYKCNVMQTSTFENNHRTFTVKILQKPVIKKLTAHPSTEVYIGDKLRIDCEAEGDPLPIYTFFKDMRNYSQWEQYNNSIVIEDVHPEDHGTYQCQAQSNVGEDLKRIFIEVLIAPNITSFPNITIQEGKEVELLCKTEGYPKPLVNISYYHIDGETVIINDHEYRDNLTYKIVEKEDMGIYTCTATNKVGTIEADMFLNVEYKPKFDSSEDTVWGWDGKMVDFCCAYNSNPPSNLTLSYVNNEIRPQTENENLLTSLDNNFDACLTINISANYYPYGLYECKATNTLGVDTKRINFREGHVPPMIINASTYSTEYTSATFVILEPESFDGPSITGITAEYDKIENFNFTDIHINKTWNKATERQYKLVNLEPNTTYWIRFSAINEVGNGEWTIYLPFETLEPTIPTTPELKNSSSIIMNITSMDQDIKWHPAESNGAPIQFYTVTYCLEDEEDKCNQVIVEPYEEELKLDYSLMEFNRTYTVNITAHNNLGDSTPTSLTVVMLAQKVEPLLSAGALIGISVLVVFLCILLLDLLLLMWRKQGIIASCCVKKSNKAEEKLQTRDKKGLLKGNREPEDSLRRSEDRHKEYEYNKTTGIITGRHSAV